MDRVQQRSHPSNCQARVWNRPAVDRDALYYRRASANTEAGCLNRILYIEPHTDNTPESLGGLVTMVVRKNKTSVSAGQTSLARTTPSPFAWFEDVDRWFDSLRRDFEERIWGRALDRVEGSDLAIREPLVDLINQGSEFVVRAE